MVFSSIFCGKERKKKQTLILLVHSSVMVSGAQAAINATCMQRQRFAADNRLARAYFCIPAESACACLRRHPSSCASAPAAAAAQRHGSGARWRWGAVDDAMRGHHAPRCIFWLVPTSPGW